MFCIKRYIWFRQVRSAGREWAVPEQERSRGTRSAVNIEARKAFCGRIIKSASGLMIKYKAGSGSTQCL